MNIALALGIMGIMSFMIGWHCGCEYGYDSAIREDAKALQDAYDDGYADGRGERDINA